MNATITDQRVETARGIIQRAATDRGAQGFSDLLYSLGFDTFLTVDEWGKHGLRNMRDVDLVMLAAGLAFS